jgi:hypothetical protein
MWPCYIDPACTAEMYVSEGQHEKQRLSKRIFFVPFLKIVCTMVQLNTCTKEHVREYIECGVASKIRCEVAAGRQSNSLAVRTVIDVTDVQHKNRQK